MRANTTIAALGYYELPVQRAISAHLQVGGICYDIGANVGFFSVLAASLVGVSGKVFAFEPEPENAAMLRHNEAANGFAQVSVIEKAVSSRAGRGTLLLTGYSGSHALAEARTPKGHIDQITVEIVQIDELVERGELSAPTLVKIDAEGAEFDVIRGMVHTIETYRPKIVYETDAEREDEARERQRNIEQLLRARDYDIQPLEDSYIGIPHYVAHFLAQPA